MIVLPTRNTFPTCRARAAGGQVAAALHHIPPRLRTTPVFKGYQIGAPIANAQLNSFSHIGPNVRISRRATARSERQFIELN